jgi:hypothetical protein
MGVAKQEKAKAGESQKQALFKSAKTRRRITASVCINTRTKTNNGEDRRRRLDTSSSLTPSGKGV